MNKLFVRWEAFVFIAIELSLIYGVEIFGRVASESVSSPASQLVFGTEAFMRQHWYPVSIPAFNAILLFAIFNHVNTRYYRFSLDVLGVYSCARVVINLCVINTMLFVSTNAPSLLLLQCGLFLPVLLIVWGWIYWRFSPPNKSVPGDLFHLQNYFDTAIPYDYFLASFRTVMAKNLVGITGSNRLGSTLILLHEIMVWNILALILTRAIGLATAVPTQ